MMPDSPTPLSDRQRYRLLRKTTWISAATNTLLAIAKIAIGKLGHSSALVADGLHSLSDLLTDALVLVAAKTGVKAPDADHPYGHQRIETLATGLIASLLIAVGLGLAYHAAQQLWLVPARSPISGEVIVVAIIAMLANEGLFRYSMHINHKIHSALLESNAWHHRSDALVSIIVLISVIGSMLGVHWLDLVGTIVIAIFIIKMAGKMIWRSLSELVDTAVEPAVLEAIKQQAQKVAGVEALHQIRSRTLAGQIYLDLHLIVDPEISVSEGHHIAEQVEVQLKRHNPKIHDITVHIDPEDDEKLSPSTNLPGRRELENMLTTRWQHLKHYPNIKRIQLHYLNGKMKLEILMHKIDASGIKDLQQEYLHACSDLEFIDDLMIYFTEA